MPSTYVIISFLVQWLLFLPESSAEPYGICAITRQFTDEEIEEFKRLMDRAIETRIMPNLEKHTKEASKRLNILESYCKIMNCRFIVSTRSTAADLEYDPQISEKELSLLKEKMQTLDIDFRKEQDKATDNVKEGYTIIGELRDRYPAEVAEHERKIDNYTNRLADLDRRYHLEVFRTQRNP